jgi:hypothetical protein
MLNASNEAGGLAFFLGLTEPRVLHEGIQSLRRVRSHHVDQRHKVSAVSEVCSGSEGNEPNHNEAEAA